MPKPEEKSDKNTKLMVACGSKTGRYDPEPPDQWRYQMNHGDAISRVVGWVKSKTIHMSRSHFAVDENGKPLTLRHMAKDLGWKYQSAVNIALEAEQEGLIRIERQSTREPGRIYLCAEVPKAWRTKSKSHNSVQSCMPPYLVEQIDRLSESQRERFYLSYEAFRGWSKEAMQDGVAEIRAYIEQAEDTTLQAFGIGKKRETKRRVKKTQVSVALPEIPDFVQSVQSEGLYNPESELYNPKNDAASLVSTDTDLKAAAAGEGTPKKTAAAAKKPTRATIPEAQELADALREADPLINAASAQRLLEACRARAPHFSPPITPGEVLQVCSGVVERKGGLQAEAWKAIKNPMGLFMSAVPGSFPGVLDELRRRIA